MKQAFFILITALFLFLIDNNQLEAQISLADSLQLVDLYNATNGDNWTNNSGWLTEPIAEWRGIKLDSLDASKIIAINLPENNLEGDLIDLQLPDLQALRFYTNQLSGEVLDFTNLPKLEILRLDLNRLSGEIPDFNFLPKLKLINLCKLPIATGMLVI